MFKKAVVIIIAGAVIMSVLAAVFLKSSFKDKDFTANKVAVIYIEGVIIGGRGQGGVFIGETGGTDSIIKQIRAAREDQDVQAVVLRINSPGGSAPASQEVGSEILKLKTSGKPVVASMADMAASGGYWIAACSDKIYANPSTLTGSIGVYVPYSNFEELYKKIGLKQEKIKSGQHKDILSPERDMTVAERAIIQAMVDDIYGQFLDVVATGRNMDYEKLKKLADGRIYTGQQAKAAGLVDELGNMYDAIDDAARMAGIQGKPQILEYGKQSPLSAWLGIESLLESLFKSRLDIGQILQLQLNNNPAFLAAPLAMPEQWP